ncbi:MAG TPA: CsgG/HfaB family protein [Spirochaetota bacterium]|nr:CsgG/HfaB family protein [Spirochaetota bacterium]
MKTVLKILLPCAVLLTALPLAAQERMRVAVLDLKADGVSTKTASAISNMLRTDLVNARKFLVIERTQMNTILEEQGFQMTGCTDSACAVKVGKLISANKILVGEVNSVNNRLFITIRIVDVEGGGTDFAARESCTEDKLEQGVASLSNQLKDQISESLGEVPRYGYYLRGIVPGWGQLYSGHDTKGYVIGGTFVAAAAFFGWSFMNFNAKKADYDDLGPGLAQSEYDSKYDAYQQAGKIAYVGLGVLGAVYLYNWIDIVFFSKPRFTAMNRPGLYFDDNNFVTMNAGYDPRESREYTMSCALTHRFE